MQEPEFSVGQRVHFTGDTRRIGTVKYVGTVDGYSGTWVGVDWDNGEAKHDGSVNGVRYFEAKSERSASFVRIQNLSTGISLLDALQLRYRGQTTKEEDDEMYVLSSSNKRVSVQLVGKAKIEDKFSRSEELTTASMPFMGIGFPGDLRSIGATLPNVRELDLTGNLLSEWKDIGYICEQLPFLAVLNLSGNLMSHNIPGFPLLRCVRILVLNNTGVKWSQVTLLEPSLPALEELHLMGNCISSLEPTSSSMIQGFGSLRLLNLEENFITEWDEMLKLSQLKCLEQLQLSNNNLKSIFYPRDGGTSFQNLRCLLLGANNIMELASIDSLNSFPSLVDIRLSENPITDPVLGGIPRFVLIARLAKVQVLNGSEVSIRERKESEIRYVRLVMSKLQHHLEDIKQLHPRFFELKELHGIEDERPLSGAVGPQKMASGLLSITLKCVGASIGEKPPLMKQLPASTLVMSNPCFCSFSTSMEMTLCLSHFLQVGKLKLLCESFFKLKSIKLRLFLQEEGSPLPMLLDDEMASLMDLGIGNESTILVDEES